MGTAPELIERAAAARSRVAVVDRRGSHTYGELLADSHAVAAALLAGDQDLGERPVAFLCQPGWHYVTTQWGIWRAGGMAVPLAVSHPEAELDYAVGHCGAATVVAGTGMLGRLEATASSRGLRLLEAERIATTPTAGRGLPAVGADRRAMVFYTSGTTGRPKGAVWTHGALAAQVGALSRAWGWSGADWILSVLPLHHVHGVINVLTAALWNGARCELLPKFDAEAAWRRLCSGEITVFMAVPTIYVRLIAAYQAAPADRRRAMSEAARGLRLMVSGSAALPVNVLQRWREISGHTLLERYGMTEIGMALSNPLDGRREPGAVGQPLPGVAVRLVDESGQVVADGVPGELEVRGPGLFSEYWDDPEATRAAFRDRWFRTGDVAVLDEGSYRILGRQSVDIIKTGGYKVSALEIEEAVREHPAVADCAVIGAADVEWGQRVCAVVELREGATLGLSGLRDWLEPRLAPSKVPRDLRVVAGLPRNAMGKVNKPALS